MLCEGSPPTGISGYDWQFNGRVKSQTNSLNQFVAWGTVQYRACGQSTANTIVEIRNLRVYALAGGIWRHYTTQNDPFNWCGDHQHDTFAYITACTEVGDGWRMPVGNRSLHWAESTDATFANDACHVVLYETRKIGSGEVMGNSGLDWRNGNSSAGDSWFGSYQRITDTFSTIGGTSCTSQQLASNLPPGVNAEN
ncbi:MAG: hypothetical protein M3P06_11520 [Acidobacteriota bacterium]|nr:hypothetical protein [Acidobacteriota bacterium]